MVRLPPSLHGFVAGCAVSTSSNRADRKKPNVTLEERGNLWYPKISCVNADEMETSLSSLRLLAPKTGLLRADFSMVGTIHNPMRLHDFPLDTDVIAIELHCHGQARVNLHTRTYLRANSRDTTQEELLGMSEEEWDSAEWTIFSQEEYKKMLGLNNGEANTGSKPEAESTRSFGNPLAAIDEDDSAADILDANATEQLLTEMERMQEMSIRQLEELVEAHQADRPHHHVKLLNDGTYKKQLIKTVARALKEQKEIEAQDNAGHATLPVNTNGYFMIPSSFTLHDWEIRECLMDEMDGPNVSVMMRVHRRPSYYFWKIIFVLHMLVGLTLTSFFFPGTETGISCRIAISSTMFLALTGLLYVAAETLPKLEYLTSCDKLIVVATLIVFFINVWNGILLRLWNSEGAEVVTDEAAEHLTSTWGSSGTIDGGDCPTTPAGVPWWLFLVDSSFLRMPATCSSLGIDTWAFRLSSCSFLLADVCLFVPPLWRRWSQESLEEIVQVDQMLQRSEEAAKARELKVSSRDLLTM